jgi:UDP-glucose:(glucosyl)LPS alpha-1,2-glucosyltransferase
MTAMTNMAILLPYKERFSPLGAGAVASVVRDQLLATAISQRPNVLGSSVVQPYLDLNFLPIFWQPVWWKPKTWCYLAAAERRLQAMSVTYIEVHGRPKYVAFLRRNFPQHRITLYLHNDLRQVPGFGSILARKALLSKVNHLVAVSDYIRHRAVDDLPEILQKKAVTVLNGVNTDQFHPSAKEQVIRFVGRLLWEKGAHVLLEALAKVLPEAQGWRAEFIGARRFENTENLSVYELDLTGKMQAIGRQVQATGYVPRDIVREKLASAAIVVIPSLWQDPCPLVALEAMASGACVVATDRGGLPEIIGDAGVLLSGETELGLVNEIVVVLRELFQSPEKLTGFQEAARVRAESVLNICHTVERLETIRGI